MTTDEIKDQVLNLFHHTLNPTIFQFYSIARDASFYPSAFKHFNCLGTSLRVEDIDSWPAINHPCCTHYDIPDSHEPSNYVGEIDPGDTEDQNEIQVGVDTDVDADIGDYCQTRKDTSECSCYNTMNLYLDARANDYRDFKSYLAESKYERCIQKNEYKRLHDIWKAESLQLSESLNKYERYFEDSDEWGKVRLAEAGSLGTCFGAIRKMCTGDYTILSSTWPNLDASYATECWESGAFIVPNCRVKARYTQQYKERIIGLHNLDEPKLLDESEQPTWHPAPVQMACAYCNNVINGGVNTNFTNIQQTCNQEINQRITIIKNQTAADAETRAAAAIIGRAAITTATSAIYKAREAAHIAKQSGVIANAILVPEAEIAVQSAIRAVIETNNKAVIAIAAANQAKTDSTVAMDTMTLPDAATSAATSATEFATRSTTNANLAFEFATEAKKQTINAQDAVDAAAQAAHDSTVDEASAAAAADKKLKLIITISSAVLLICLIGAIMSFIFKSKKKTSE